MVMFSREIGLKEWLMEMVLSANLPLGHLMMVNGSKMLNKVKVSKSGTMEDFSLWEILSTTKKQGKVLSNMMVTFIKVASKMVNLAAQVPSTTQRLANNNKEFSKRISWSEEQNRWMTDPLMRESSRMVRSTVEARLRTQTVKYSSDLSQKTKSMDQAVSLTSRTRASRESSGIGES